MSILCSASGDLINLLLFKMPTVHLLDYVAGNVRSLVNAIEKLGYEVEWIKTPREVSKAEVMAASQFYTLPANEPTQ
jgi:hypothetical protein